MKYYKFVNWDVPAFETIQNPIIDALRAADAGNMEQLKKCHIATTSPVIKRAGWAVSLREYLKRYWVKTKYYGIQEYFALCKMDIRAELKSNAVEIIEIPGGRAK